MSFKKQFVWTYVFNCQLHHRDFIGKILAILKEIIHLLVEELYLLTAAFGGK
jgi:hypothetical protein